MDRNGPSALLQAVFAADADEHVFRALQTPERRYVLYHLLDAGPTALENLADVVAGWMTAAHGDPTDRVDRDRLKTALHHTHLPILSEAELVAVRDDDVVEPTLSPDARELIETAYLTEHWTDEAET